MLDQGYPRLEYVVMDGGSTDGSVAILERYSSQLTFWSSGKDDGQYDAVGKGLAQTKGEVIGWINSDDAYLPGCLSIVGEIFARFPEIEWLTTLIRCIGMTRTAGSCRLGSGIQSRRVFGRRYLPAAATFFWLYPEESAFWRRSLWERPAAKSTRCSGWLAISRFGRGSFNMRSGRVAAPLAGLDHRDQRIAGPSARIGRSASASVHYGGRRVPRGSSQRAKSPAMPVALHRFLAGTGMSVVRGGPLGVHAPAGNRRVLDLNRVAAVQNRQTPCLPQARCRERNRAASICHAEWDFAAACPLDQAPITCSVSSRIDGAAIKSRTVQRFCGMSGSKSMGHTISRDRDDAFLRT